MTKSFTNFKAIDNLIFKSDKVRAAYVDDVLMFCLSDICKILGIVNASDATKRLREKEKKTINLSLASIYNQDVSWGGSRRAIFITESGVFRIIMRSDKPEAVEFQDWVIEEVLPTIHRYGMYIEPEQAKKIAQRQDDISSLIDDLITESNKAASAEVHAAMYRMLSKMDSDMELGEFARVLVSHGFSLGPNKILKLFRELGVLTRHNTIRMKFITRNWFSAYVYLTEDDRITARTTITERGIKSILHMIYARPDLVDKYSRIDTSPKRNRKGKDLIAHVNSKDDDFIILQPKADKTMESIIAEMKARAGK